MTTKKGYSLGDRLANRVALEVEHAAQQLQSRAREVLDVLGSRAVASGSALGQGGGEDCMSAIAISTSHGGRGRTGEGANEGRDDGSTSDHCDDVLSLFGERLQVVCWDNSRS